MEIDRLFYLWFFVVSLWIVAITYLAPTCGKGDGFYNHDVHLGR